MRRDVKKVSIFFLVAFIGIILGGLLGEIAGNIPYLSFLKYGKEIGFENPIVLNLSVIKLTFALTLNCTISCIVGFLLSIFIYMKL